MIQSLDGVIKKTKQLFNENPNRSLSAAYREFRNDPKISLIGDYPIMSCMVRSAGQKFTAKQIQVLVHQSKELGRICRGDKCEVYTSLKNTKGGRGEALFSSRTKDDSKVKKVPV